MKSSCTTLLLFCLPAFALSQQTLYDSILHEGLMRKYILYVPDSYAPGTAAPLLFNFHGYTSDALQQMFYGDFRPIADTAGFLLVHPQGTLDQLGNTHWNIGWGLSTVNDVGFTAALIDSLSMQYDIDPERIYSTGMSNGGFFSYKLACELSERIAAIASVTGSMNVNKAQSCLPDHPMPVMEIHGTADQTVPYNGSFLFAPIPSVLQHWIEFNDCDPLGEIEMIPDTDPSDGCTVERQVYHDGTNGAVVEHYKIINGAHTWPGSAFGGVGTNQDIDASKEIWRFFSRYDIHGLIEEVSSTDQQRDDSVNVYPNPATDRITIESGSDNPMNFFLSTMHGMPVRWGIITGTQVISVSGLPQGMYFLSVDEKVIKVEVTD